MRKALREKIIDMPRREAEESANRPFVDQSGWLLRWRGIRAALVLFRFVPPRCFCVFAHVCFCGREGFALAPFTLQT
jgi:hypothetical protein